MRELYESLIAQTHEALDRGAVGLAKVRSNVDVEAFQRRFGIDGPQVREDFEAVVSTLVRKIIEEAHDGVRPPS